MDFSLSEEQLLLKDSITTFVDKDYLFDVRQKILKPSWVLAQIFGRPLLIWDG